MKKRQKREKVAAEQRKSYDERCMNPRKKYAFPIDFSFLAQNLRRMKFEDQILLGMNTGTVIACFFPWVSTAPYYAPAKLINAFMGITWLMGTLVFCLALFSVLLFVDEVFQKRFFHLKVPRTILLGAASTQSLFLQLCTWSVLQSLSNMDVEFRFGLALCVLFQLLALVAVWLRFRSSKKTAVNDFFQLPKEKKSEQSSTPSSHTK